MRFFDIKNMKESAGILMYRENENQLEFLLLRPGGLFYKNQNEGIWTIPKGIIKKNEDHIEAAKREFEEETGQKIITELTYVGKEKIRKGKTVTIFITKGDLDVSTIQSNTFRLEYPKNSGQHQFFPEIECGEWFTYEIAKNLIHPKLIIFLDKCMSYHNNS